MTDSDWLDNDFPMLERFIDILTEFKVTQQQFADAVGISRQAVNKIVLGRNAISPVNARAAEIRLGIPKHRLRPDVFGAPESQPNGTEREPPHE